MARRGAFAGVCFVVVLMAASPVFGDDGAVEVENGPSLVRVRSCMLPLCFHVFFLELRVPTWMMDAHTKIHGTHNVHIFRADTDGEHCFLQVLTDKNFEHDTQAVTGATTGDWLIEFYAPWVSMYLRT